MNKNIFLVVIIMIASMTMMASASIPNFKESAGTFIFNLTKTSSQEIPWKLINAGNESLNFNIILPNFNGIVLTVSQNNGIITPHNDITISVNANRSGIIYPSQFATANAYVFVNENTPTNSLLVIIKLSKEIAVYNPPTTVSTTTIIQSGAGTPTITSSSTTSTPSIIPPTTTSLTSTSTTITIFPEPSTTTIPNTTALSTISTISTTIPQNLNSVGSNMIENIAIALVIFLIAIAIGSYLKKKEKGKKRKKTDINGRN